MHPGGRKKKTAKRQVWRASKGGCAPGHCRYDPGHFPRCWAQMWRPTTAARTRPPALLQVYGKGVSGVSRGAQRAAVRGRAGQPGGQPAGRRECLYTSRQNVRQTVAVCPGRGGARGPRPGAGQSRWDWLAPRLERLEGKITTFLESRGRIIGTAIPFRCAAGWLRRLARCNSGPEIGSPPGA